MFTKSAAFLLLPALAAAQYGAPAGPAGGASTTTSSAAVAAPTAPANTAGHVNVNVAFDGNFVFNPNNITASVGTLVTFYFPGGSIPHSVTQSSFADPCTYLAASNSTSGGFDSGLVSSPSTFSINITDTNPIWFHCKEPTHCPVSGMVGSINAPSTGNTFAAFQSAAMALGSSAPVETDHGAVTGGVGAVATAGPVSDTGSSSSSSSATKVVASAGFALLSAAIAICMA